MGGEIQKRRVLDEQSLNTYEGAQSITHTQLGYRDMNAQYWESEKGKMSGEEWASRRKLHEHRKKTIEAEWHENTQEAADGLLSEGNSSFSRKQKEFYGSFSLLQMEVLLKNSDRGGNSDDYNRVATDLELYNVALAYNKSGFDQSEKRMLLTNLVGSCSDYIAKKNPFFSKGKMRKAMIEQVYEQAKKELDQMEPVTTQVNATQVDASQTVTSASTMATTTVQAKTNEQVLKEAEDAFAAVTAQRTQENTKAAFEAYGVILQRILSKEMKVSSSKRKKIDQNMKELFTMIQSDAVAEGQSDCFTTRFCNALGLSDKKPTVTDAAGLEEAKKKSPIKAIMYHTINPKQEETDSSAMVEQLFGKGRQYYSDGIHGRGTYTSYSLGGDVPVWHKGDSEEWAKAVSWGYGQREGAIQVSMVINEKSRIIEEDELKKKIKSLEELFPEMVDCITNNQLSALSSYMDKHRTLLGIYAALLGYNVVNIPESGKMSAKFALVVDRSALTVSKDVAYRMESLKLGLPSYSMPEGVEVRRINYGGEAA